MPDADAWLRKLAKLRVDSARGDPAPHKPLLILVVLEMAEQGELGGELPLSPDLAFRFSVFWGTVAHRRNTRPDVRLPLHHLGSDGLWEPLMADGSRSPDKKLTLKVRLDPNFLVVFSSLLIATVFGWMFSDAFQDHRPRLCALRQ